METMETDEALMLRYAEDDYFAFKTLYQKHYQPLCRFIAWQSPRLDWAEEVIQDTWMRIHNARKEYTPQSSFKTYLYQIAKNRLTDLIRQRNELLATDLGKASDESDTSTFDALADQSGSDDTPEESMQQRQQHEALHAAIKKLPLEQREALTMQQFGQLSIEEIAEITGVTNETVKSRLRYAMNKLRQQLTLDE